MSSFARFAAGCGGRIAAAARAVPVAVVRLYQATLRPILPACCRFTPTCSEYMIEAVRKKGAIRGLALGLWRLLRCNPFCAPGHDPVERVKGKT